MTTLRSLSVIFGLYLSLLVGAAAAEPPKELGDYLVPGEPAKGQLVRMHVDPEFNKFTDLLALAKQKDPKWFKEFQEKADKKNPIPPYHSKLGMTKADYDKYLKIWSKRKFKKVEKGSVELMLMEVGEGEWTVSVTGKGMPVSLLKYREATGDIISTNGVMKRIEDINSPSTGLYREWSGHEWRYFNESNLVKAKENFAIGRTGDKRYGLLVYSLQEVSAAGTMLADKLLMIRFVPKKVK